MTTKYESDIVAWAAEQARMIRAGELTNLDLQNIAEEIADVGKSEQRELASRMAVLLAHLIKWKFQPSLRSRSWEKTIRVQRNSINRRLMKTPSLRVSLIDTDWQSDAWDDAVAQATSETGLSEFPDACPWDFQQAITSDFMPD